MITNKFRNVRSLLIGAIALLLAAMALVPIARADSSSRGMIVSFAYDAASKTLLEGGTEGLFMSADGGRNWRPIPLGDAQNTSITSVTVGAVGTIYVAGPGIGLERSDDQGATWINVQSALPGGTVRAAAAHATEPGTVYVFVAGSGIYRSRDKGGSWKLMDRGDDNTTQLLHTNMAGSMESGWLYAVTMGGVKISMDCFCFWRDTQGLISPIESIAFDTENPSQLYAAAAGRIYSGAKGGQTWTAVNTPQEAPVAVAMLPGHALYAASRRGALFRSGDGGATWTAAP